MPADAHRSRIRSFDRNASTFDARWICSQPKFANVSLLGLVGANLKDMYLTGNVQLFTLVPPMVMVDESVTFDCSFFPIANVSETWTLATCPLNYYSSSTAYGLMGTIGTAYSNAKVQKHGA